MRAAQHVALVLHNEISPRHPHSCITLSTAPSLSKQQREEESGAVLMSPVLKAMSPPVDPEFGIQPIPALLASGASLVFDPDRWILLRQEHGTRCSC